MKINTPDIKSKLPLLLSYFVILLFSLYRSGFIVEADIYWQTRAGLDWLKNYQIITNNGWAYLNQNNWIPNSWGWNLILGISYKYFSDFGLFLVGFLSSFSMLLLLIRILRKLEVTWIAIHVSLSAILIFSLPVLAVRPALFSALAAMLVLSLCEGLYRYLESSPIKSALIIFLFNVFMINCHLSWPAYLFAAFIGLVAYSLIQYKKKEFIKHNLIIGLTALVGILCNPLGLDLFEHIFFTVNQSTGLIYEWRSLWSAPIYIIPVIFISWLVLTQLRNPKLSQWTYATATFTILGIFAIRFIPWAFIFSAPLVCTWLTQLLSSSWCQKRSLIYSTLFTGIIVIIFIPFAIDSLNLRAQPRYLSSIKQLPPHCHLTANSLHSGAVLLYRPDVKVFVDGRNDFWGKRPYEIIEQLQISPSDELMNQARPNCILLEKGTALSSFLKNKSEWKLTSDAYSQLEVWAKF